MQSLVLLSFFKQKARQLKNEKSLSLGQARNEVAKELGYSNYKNYLNLLENKRKQSLFSKETHLKKIFSEQDGAKKIELAISAIQNPKISFPELFEIIKLFPYPEFIEFALEVTKLKNEFELYLLNGFQTAVGKGDIESFYQLYMAKEISMNNMHYKLAGNKIYVDGCYELKIAFEHEVPDELKEEPHFKDRFLIGTFEVTLDKNKKITLVDSSIGEQLEFSGFTEEELADYYQRFPEELGTFPPPTSLSFEVVD